MINLFNGECLEVMKDIETGSVDMILCDLPYGTTACKWDEIIPLDEMWNQYNRIIKQGGVIALTASQPFTSKLVMSNIKNFKVEWIWKKNAGSNFGSVRWQPMKEHEAVLIFSKGKSTYNPIMEERAESGLSRVKTAVNYSTNAEVYGDSFKNEISSMRPDLRVPSSVQKFNRERGLHPTQKPVALYKWLLNKYAKEGDKILDTHLGSGSIAIACHDYGFDLTACELDTEYYNNALKRLQQHQAQLQMF